MRMITQAVSATAAPRPVATALAGSGGAGGRLPPTTTAMVPYQGPQLPVPYNRGSTAMVPYDGGQSRAMVPYQPPGGGGGGGGAGGGADLFNFKTGGEASMFGSMMDSGGMRAAAAGALIGGTASYATGGEFGAGALAGGAAGFGARAIHQSLQANSKFLSKGIQQAAGGEGMKAKAAQMVMNNQSSIQTVQQRHAMMAGAGLFGVVGGGERNRNNHRRGFNAHRGNGF